MNVYRRFHNATHFVSATGVLLYALFAQAPGMGAIGLLFVFIAWRLFRNRTRSPVPRAVINLLLVVASIGMFFRVAGAPNDAIVILAEYLVVLLLIKLFEHRTPRDQAQSLSICGMLGVGAVLSTVSVWMGLVLLVHLLGLLVAATRYQLWAGHHATFAPSNQPSDEPIGAPTSAGKRTRVRSAGITLVLALTIAMGSIIVFVLLPRRDAGAGGNTLNFTHSRDASMVSGFRDHVQLGAAGLISLSRAVVGTAELRMNGEVLDNAVPRYFRGASLDRYNLSSGAWERSATLKRFDDTRLLSLGQMNSHYPAHLDRGREALPPIDVPARVQAYPRGLRYIEQDISLVNKASPNLFALAHPLHVALNRNRAITMNPIDRSLLMRSGSGGVSYEVRSAVDFALPPLPDEAEEYASARALSLKEFRDNPVGVAMNELAREIMAERGYGRDFEAPPSREDVRIIDAFEDYLSDECAYTLEIVAPDGQQDPTLYFLFDAKKGHCEYFASALAGLCRSVGIDARVVTGYVTSEVDDEGRYVIRQSNAHAWVEAPVLTEASYRASDDDPDSEIIREERLVWRTFDPSPREMVGGMRTASAEWINTLRLWLYRFEDIWVNTVVDYDADKQKDLLGVENPDQRFFGEGLLKDLSASPLAIFSGAPGWVRRAAPFAIVIVGLVAIGFVLRRMPAKGERPGVVGLDRATRRRVERIDRALVRAGTARPGYRPYLEHASLIGDELGATLSRVARVLYAQRFGGAAPDERALNDAIAELERTAKGHA